MRTVIALLLMLSLAAAWEDCPFGLVNDSYPGQCGRYVDTNGDGLCDLSQAAPVVAEAPEPAAALQQNGSVASASRTPVVSPLPLDFIGHIATSMVSAALILVLALQLRLKRMMYHRQIAYLMVVTGLVSLAFAFSSGIVASPDLRGLHNLSGFFSLGLSLAPMVFSHRSELHCKLAYASAIFAVVSIVTGIAAYLPMLSRLLG